MWRSVAIDSALTFVDSGNEVDIDLDLSRWYEPHPLEASSILRRAVMSMMRFVGLSIDERLE